MVKFETVFQSEELSAVLITAEYTGAYSEEDFAKYPAISFPLKSAFDFKAGKKTFLLDTNHILFERGETEFTVSKFSTFNSDITLSITFLKPDSELSIFLLKNKKNILVQRRTLQAEILLRRFYSIAFSKNETLKEQLLIDIVNSVAFDSRTVNKSERTSPHSIKQVDRSKDFIHACYHENLCIADIASSACLSVFHFSRLFRQVTGYTPYDYLLLSRIENAKSLLDKGVSVTQTAFSVGFNSLDNFSYAFSKMVGNPPSSYRKRQDF